MNDIVPQFDGPVKHCDQCGRDLPETVKFWHRKGGKQVGFRVPCKDCRNGKYAADPEIGKRMARKQREALLVKSSEEQEEIRVHQNKLFRARSVKQRQAGMCSSCLARAASIGKLCDHCVEKLNRYGDDLRDQVFAAYGGKCVVCGESHPAFLAVDHVNDDGADQRRSIGGGHRLYRWLRKQGFPQDGFQLLCHNHNWLKRLQQHMGEKTYIMIWYAKLRQETFAAYGGKCSCCGEDRHDVLTIDHVNNDGAEHRREIGHGGANLYGWLRKQGFPQDGRFALLCFNCNRARFYYGACPHQNS